MTTSRQLLVPVFAVVLLVAVSHVPAGRGNLGEPIILTGGSQVDVIIGSNPPFTRIIMPPESNIAVKNSLVSSIDASPLFKATSSTDPFDPNAVVFEVLTESGEEVHDFQICETSTSLTTLGAYMPMGKDVVLIDLPTVVNANGSYTLTLRRWDGPSFTHTYDTTISPNNTVAGLISSVKTDLTGGGFNVFQGSTFLSISRTGDMMTSVKIVATDTGIVNTCTRLVPSTGSAPTLSQYGIFALVLLMTVAAMLMLRRKSSESGAPSRS